ncbi:MAG: LPS assembly protein LptD [Verrucomicrobiae bacterium]|nr:LPS assembly protein LptD [Verrucomicrobiae bacterium]NNJ43451.1 LPS-assembly protein LptD [Akkermansiaceae bacterium]
MRQFGISILLSLCILPLNAQDDAIQNKPAGENDLFAEGFSDMPEMPSSIRVTHDGTLEFDSQKGNFLFQGRVVLRGDNGIVLKSGRVLVNAQAETAKLTGRVSFRQKATKDDTGRTIPGIQLFADRVHLNAKTKTVVLDGNVSIYQGPSLHRGNHAEYHYGTGHLDTRGLASGLGPILLESDRFRMIDRHGKKAFIGDNAGITTHDVAAPNYWLRSDRTTIYPNDRVIFKNLRVYAGKTPVFWLPYLAQPLNTDLGYHFLPGAKSNWGAYLLNRYGIMLGGELDEETGEREDAWLLSQWHLDLRSRRGVGVGLDLLDTRLQHNENLTGLKLYYLHDADPSLERSAVPRGNVNANRWKLELKHRLDVAKRGDNHTYLDFDITALSDRYFLEDFEPGMFKINPNPDNEVGIFHRHPRYLAGLYTRLRLNDFYQTDTRLPELFFDQIKAPICNTPILHEGQTTFGVYDDRLADYYANELRREASTLPPGDRLTEINGLLAERGYTRFHTWHELTLPLNPGGKVAITPRAGIGYTQYSSVDGGGKSFNRTHLSAGIDASMKFSRVYPEFVHPSWGVDGLLHIFQPYANFSQLSTNQLDSSFVGIETLTPSTRPRPLEVGRFTATDDLRDWSILRLGARNRLLTKRDGDSHEWLVMDTYMDVFMNDPEFGRNTSNLYNDIIWQPLPWMRVDFETQFPIAAGGSGFTEIASHITFMPNDALEFSIGSRQLDNHPVLQDSNRINLRAYARISESWGIGLYQQWELDDNTPEVQQYNIYHDFDSWTASLGLMIRDNRDDSNEYGLMLNFTLKEFPAVRLPLSVDNE